MAKNTKKPTKTEETKPDTFVGAFAELTNSAEKEEGQQTLVPKIEVEEVKPKKKMGAPSTYSLHIAKVICIRLSNGEALAQIIKDEGMPAQSTVYKWLLDHPEFTEMYTRAREEQADSNADEIIMIADETPDTDPVIDRRTGELIRMDLSSAYIAWQKSRIEARKWTAMKLKPRKYGDKLAVGGDVDNPLEVGTGMLEALIKNLELKAQANNAE